MPTWLIEIVKAAAYALIGRFLKKEEKPCDKDHD